MVMGGGVFFYIKMLHAHVIKYLFRHWIEIGDFLTMLRERTSVSSLVQKLGAPSARLSRATPQAPGRNALKIVDTVCLKKC